MKDAPTALPGEDHKIKRVGAAAEEPHPPISFSAFQCVTGYRGAVSQITNMRRSLKKKSLLPQKQIYLKWKQDNLATVTVLTI